LLSYHVLSRAREFVYYSQVYHSLNLIGCKICGRLQSVSSHFTPSALIGKEDMAGRKRLLTVFLHFWCLLKTFSNPSSHICVHSL
jgi:hypothetical protein